MLASKLFQDFARQVCHSFCISQFVFELRRSTRTMADNASEGACNGGCSAAGADAAEAAGADRRASSGSALSSGYPGNGTSAELLTKEEAPSAPGISRIIDLTEGSQMVRFTNGVINPGSQAKKPEAIFPDLYDALVRNFQAQAQPTVPFAMYVRSYRPRQYD